MEENWFQREFLVNKRRLAFNILFYSTHLALFAYGWYSQVSQSDYLLYKSDFSHSRRLICAWPHSTRCNIQSGFLVALVSFLHWMVVLSLSRCCATSFESSVPSLHGCSPWMKTFGSIDRSPTRWLSGQWSIPLPTMSTLSMLSVLVSICLHITSSFRLNWLQRFERNLPFRSIIPRLVASRVISCFSSCF